MELLDNQLKEQKTLIKLLEKNKLSAKDRQGVLDTLKQLTNSIDQRRSSIKALEHDMEMSQRRIAKVSGPVWGSLAIWGFVLIRRTKHDFRPN